MTPKIAAFVPMRHESERVMGKNYRPLGGRPLFHHIVTTLLSVPEISAIAIDTDSPLIAEQVGREFPDLQVIDRPEHLRGGEVPMNEVLLHDVSQVPADVYVQSHSTNPFLRPGTVSRAISAYLESVPTHDSLFTVTALQSRFWTLDGQAVNHDPSILLRTQDLPPIYEENSCLYIFTAEVLMRRGSRIGAHPLLYPIDRLEAQDIDDEHDWAIVSALYDEQANRG
jgi:CMP-N-acetylneuraminic acid synthetase